LPEPSEHRGELGGQPVFWRSAGDDDVPVLFLHGVPTSSDDWVPLLRRTGGLAPDLPGFGRSGKRGDGDFTMHGIARFTGEFLDLVGAERVRLVVHDWGAAGLVWAQREPERVERLVIVNAVPLVAGFRWHLVGARVAHTRPG
jgi:pimeloyl-ACP methyl ester carboxylesterase